MHGNGGEQPVLVVDDEPEVADMLALQLEREYSVTTVYGGEDALASVGPGVDLVLLDRRMPDLSGDEVLSTIRERGEDCRVVMVSAVSPDFDVLEMGFDDYLAKPVGGDTLMTAVALQMRTLGHDDLAAYLSMVAKRCLLESTKPAYELEEHDGYQALVARVDELREQLGGDGGLADLEAAFAGIDRV